MPKTRSLRSLLIGTPSRVASPGPPSPTLTETTNASAFDLGASGLSKIITRGNLRASLQAYETLVSACASYRAALLTLSKTTAAFADAMETCAGLKGPSYEAGTRLQAASGLHHLMGNHWHVLADTLENNFDKPLREHLHEYRTTVHERSQTYEKALREKSRIIRETEMRNMRNKGRNLQSFRESLAVLQKQVDDLDELKTQHYQDIAEHEEQVWDFVHTKVSLVVRSSMEVFDRFTAKASDPVLEPMLQSVPDPFDSYGPAPASDQIFSILAPLSIIAQPSPLPSPHVSTPDLTYNGDGQDQGWPGAFYAPAPASGTAEWADVPASPPPRSPEASSSTPRSASPRSTSPPPTHVRSPQAQRKSYQSHHARRSTDSKMRSVLTVIDEGASAKSKIRDSSDASSGSDVTVNGDGAGTSNWTALGIDADNQSQSATALSTPLNGEEDNTTPRTSAFFPESISSPPDDIPSKHRSRESSMTPA